MNIKKWTEQNTHDLSGKTVVLTGATGGLGKQLCFSLADLNANLILACRNKAKTDKLIEEILTFNPNINVEFLPLDLEDIVSVKNFVNQLKNKPFHYFIHNSGIYNVPRTQTSSGIDNVFQVNFVAPYYITKELMPTFRANNVKVVAVGSIAHNYSKLDEDDIEFKTRKKSSHIYGNSKRFLMFSLFELFKNETSTSLSIAHPGVTLTNITNHYHKSINWLVKGGIKLFFPSPKMAVTHLVYALFNNCNYHEWIGPTKCGVWGKPKKSVLKTCSEEESKKIFEIAENYYQKLN